MIKLQNLIEDKKTMDNNTDLENLKSNGKTKLEMVLDALYAKLKEEDETYEAELDDNMISIEYFWYYTRNFMHVEFSPDLKSMCILEISYSQGTRPKEKYPDDIRIDRTIDISDMEPDEIAEEILSVVQDYESALKA